MWLPNEEYLRAIDMNEEMWFTNVKYLIENVGFSFCLLIIMKLNYVPDLYKQN